MHRMVSVPNLPFRILRQCLKWEPWDPSPLEALGGILERSGLGTAFLRPSRRGGT